MEMALGSHPQRMTERLASGAREFAERWLAARRGKDGEWVGLSYAAALQNARAIGQALLSRDLSAERPLATLSGNGHVRQCDRNRRATQSRSDRGHVAA
ncbi:hypothetical protein [Paraburkholderia xenovorans]